MKNIIRFSLLILFCLLLIGCVQDNSDGKNDSIKLDSPGNLRIDNEFVKWNIVELSNGYIISINLDEYLITDNYYDLKNLNLANGSYVIKVKAVGNGDNVISSDYCDEITHQISDDDFPIDDPKRLSTRRYVILDENILNEPELQYIYSQEQYLCYVYYLGKIESVPVSYGAAELYNGLSPIEITYSKTSLSEQSITESKSRCFTETSSLTNTKTIEHSLGIQVGTGSESKLNFQANIKFARTDTTTNVGTTSSSFNDTFTTVQKFNETQSETRKYLINENYDPNYYYRITLFSDCDLYAFAMYDSIEKRVDITFDLSPINSTMYYYIDKSDSPNFSATDSYKSKLQFDPEILINTDLFNHKYTPISKDLGTKEEPYIISNPTDFINKMKYDGPNIYFILTNYIDFEKMKYNYLYSPKDKLEGVIFGNGYSIKNYYKNSMDSENSGFFKTIAVTGKILDLKFESIEFQDITSTGTNLVFAGIVCGRNYGTISNVIVNNSRLANVYIGKIQVDTSYYAYSGFICGQSEKGSIIEKCGVTNSYLYTSSRTGYKVADSYAAGIAGRSDTDIEYCYSRNNTITAFTKGSIKGLFGRIKGKLFSYAGGIVGRLYSGNSVQYCIVYNNNVNAESIEADNHAYSDDISPENNGSKTECYKQNSIPASFPSAIWINHGNGPEINFPWKISD